MVAVRIWPATSNGAAGVFEPMPTLPVAIMVDVVMVEVAFNELTPNVENMVVPPLPPLPVPGGRPLILETVSVDRTRSLDVMLDTDKDDADMINPVSIDMVNVDPVMVETDRVDAVSVEVTLMELALKVEYAPTPGAPLLILETDRVDMVMALPVRVDAVMVDPDSVDTLMDDAFIVDPVSVEIAIALVFKVDTLMVELKIRTLRFAKNDMASLLRSDKGRLYRTRDYEGMRRSVLVIMCRTPISTDVS